MRFDSWGLDRFHRDEFGRLAAAWGMLRRRIVLDEIEQWISVERTAFVESIDPHGTQKLHEWRYPPPRTISSDLALELLKDWQSFLDRRGAPRLQLLGVPPSEQSSLVELLSSPKVGVSSMFVRDDRPEMEVNWNWPLRVGFLDNAASHALYESLMGVLKKKVRNWKGDYVQLIPPGELTSSGCHVLILPSGLRQALSTVATAPGKLRAAFALVLGDADDWHNAGIVLQAIRVQARAGGAAVFNAPTHALKRFVGSHFPKSCTTREVFWAGWFLEWVKVLSHNRTLDEALYEVWHAMGREGLPPLVVASHSLIEESRISDRMKRLGKQLEHSDLRSYRIKIGPRTARRLRMMPGTQELRQFCRTLQDQASYLDYSHETEAGSAVLDLVAELRRVRRQLTPRPPRWVQAVVSTASSTQTVRAFRAGADHVVDVFVGPRRPDAIQPPADSPPVPEDNFPGDRGVRLKVVFVELNSERQPQVSTVFLPREGQSSMCRFVLTVNDNSRRDRQVVARIIVLHRNRVLQTSLLRGPIEDSRGRNESEIIISPEVVVHEDLEQLDARADFDATIVLNHDSNDTPGLIVMEEDRARRVPLTGIIKDAEKRFDDFMESVADKARSFTGFASKANLELLRTLAQEGRLLWQAFQDVAPPGFNFEGYERLQIVSADPETRLPVEFFYDRVAPTDNATLCAGAEEFLRTGKPCIVCASRASEDPKVICPSGFWGLRKILERHLHQRGDLPDTGNHIRVAGPVPDRDVLCPLGSFVFAASQKVDAQKKGGIAAVAKALNQACGPGANPVADWDQWVSAVKAKAAHLLLLIPHVIDDGQQAIEIGVDSRLKAAHIGPEHVRTPSDRDPPPIMILLGCKTGNATFQFANLIAPCRRSGAAVVLCTGAPIVGRHAVPVALALLKALEASANLREPHSLGDVIREVRRALILDGLPMVFTVIAFGDTDWQIGNTTAVNAALSASKKRRPMPVRQGELLVTP